METSAWKCHLYIIDSKITRGKQFRTYFASPLQRNSVLTTTRIFRWVKYQFLAVLGPFLSSLSLIFTQPALEAQPLREASKHFWEIWMEWGSNLSLSFFQEQLRKLNFGEHWDFYNLFTFNILSGWPCMSTQTRILRILSRKQTNCDYRVFGVNFEPTICVCVKTLTLCNSGSLADCLWPWCGPMPWCSPCGIKMLTIPCPKLMELNSPLQIIICNTIVPTKVDLVQANQLADVWSLVFGKSGSDLLPPRLSIEDQLGKVAIWWQSLSIDDLPQAISVWPRPSVGWWGTLVGWWWLCNKPARQPHPFLCWVLHMFFPAFRCIQGFETVYMLYILVVGLKCERGGYWRDRAPVNRVTAGAPCDGWWSGAAYYGQLHSPNTSHHIHIRLPIWWENVGEGDFQTILQINILGKPST